MRIIRFYMHHQSSKVSIDYYFRISNHRCRLATLVIIHSTCASCMFQAPKDLYCFVYLWNILRRTKWLVCGLASTSLDVCISPEHATINKFELRPRALSFRYHAVKYRLFVAHVTQVVACLISLCRLPSMWLLRLSCLACMCVRARAGR